MEDIINAQRAYFNSNATKPVAFRIEQLNKLKAMILANEDAFNAAIQADYGKQRFETFVSELFFIYEQLNDALNGIEEWSTPTQVPATPLTSPGTCYSYPEPLGVSLVIGPWNYPFQLAIAPAVAAIAAGCTVVIKPSELTPNCSALTKKLIEETFDPRFIAVVEGGIAETTELLAQNFDMIFFTGSVPVGKVVYQAAAKNLTPVVLELGGKSPTIIAADADLEVAARRLVWAKYVNAGQTCIAPDYAYIHSSVYEDFIAAFAAEVKKADYSFANANYVQIVNERNAQRVSALIDPAKVVIGGNFDIATRYIEPTVMKDVTWDDAVMQQEIFGPLYPMMAYDDVDAVIAEIKAHDKPLALYLFTQDEALKTKVLSEVSFGGGCVNDAIMQVTHGGMPFGGVGASGIGSYHGIDGFRAFSHYKGIVDREVGEDNDTKYPPYTEEKYAIMRAAVGV